MKAKKWSIILILALALSLMGAIPVGAEEIPDVTEYSYTVTPILSPFSYYLYVRTDNPDPTSFRLVDKSSKFYGPEDHSNVMEYDNEYDSYYYVEEDPGTYYISQNLYPDVAYEDESIYRVSGGYIFKTEAAYSDGGEFVLLQKTEDGEDSDSILHDRFEETNVTIPCQTLNTRVGYLIDTCTTDEMSFFEKLDAVDAWLSEIAVYPRSVYDSNSPNEDYPYPLLAASPYPELILNEHYSMYNVSITGMLASNAYPFVLDSLGFPGTIAAVAEELEPECEAVMGAYHFMTDVTFQGETRTYGGQGIGGNDPLYSNRVKKAFTFRGGEDLGTDATIEEFRDLLWSYGPVAGEDAEEYWDLIQGETFRETIGATGGTWIRIGTEGLFGYGTSFGYAVPLGDSVRIASDAWVDGRYIGEHETIYLNEKFEDHPTADIVLQDVTYLDCDGNAHTQDVIYSYDAEADVWSAPDFYGNGWYFGGDEIPQELILTREQVEAMELDGNHHLPERGLVYDGREYPGTPFTLKLTTGVQIPETLEIYEGQEQTITAQVIPADAYDTRVSWTSSDPTVVEILYDDGTIHGVSEGTAVLTVVTSDGAYSAACTVTVLPDPCKDGHTFGDWITVMEPTTMEEGLEERSCAFCDETEQREIARLPQPTEPEPTESQPIEPEPTKPQPTDPKPSDPKPGDPKPSDPAPSEPSGQSNPFEDVKAGAYYYDSVLWAVDNSITTGMDATHFGPEAGCTRGHVVTFLWRAAGEPAPGTDENPFVDVKPGAYYYEAVLWAVENGITKGMDATHFAPDTTCTRGQIVTFLWRFSGSPEADAGVAFADVPDGQYYTTAVAWAVENEITNGMGNNRFQPDSTCTRGQIVTFLYRAMG